MASTAKRRYQDVAEALKQDIVARGCAVGDRLRTERQISEDMGVSRSVVREAVIMLEIEGLVEVRKGSGIYLARLPHACPNETAVDFGPFELLQARQLLESSIAALAAVTVTKADIMQMRQALALENKAIEAGDDDYSGDELFHRLIAEATQNAVLVDMVEELWRKRAQSRMWARLHNRIFDKTYRSNWLSDHHAILNALQMKDAPTARQAMWQHLENVRLTLMALSDVDDPEFDGYLFSSEAIAPA